MYRVELIKKSGEKRHVHSQSKVGGNKRHVQSIADDSNSEYCIVVDPTISTVVGTYQLHINYLYRTK